MAFSGNSLANLSKQINADPTIKEAVDAQKEYESLLESRRRSKPIVPTADEIRHSSEPSTTKPKRKKRRGLSKQETIAPKSTRTSHVRHASVDTVSRALATDPKNTARNQPQSQLFRTTCQYKKPSTLLRAPDFKSRFIVIDNHFKFMRIYRNEQELKNREPFKYELPLQHCTISIKNVQNRRECVILIIRKQEHTFHFDTDEIRQDAMQHIECCRTHAADTKTMPQITDRMRRTATTVTSMVNEYERQRSLTDTGNTTQTDMNADMLLELYAETDKGRDVARWLNQNKTFVTVQQLQKLGDILRDKQRDHTFIQDFAAGQGLTYLCSISILRQYEWDILVMILDIFQIILNTRDADHGLIGYHGLIEHSHAIQAIVDMFESKNKTVKCKVIRLCTIMCMSDDAGFEAVLKGMYTYGERHNASSVFDEFVRSMYFEQDLEFRRDALKFVNAVLNLSPDLKRRIDSRHMLRELGFNNILDQLWDVIASEQDEDSDHTQDDTDEETPSTSDLLTTARSNAHEGKKNKRKLRYDASVTVQHPLLAEIREQLLLYRQTKEEDDKKVLWEDVNLNDPEQIVRHLFKKAMQQKHISEFMQTLISLCTIPDHASALWGALPELILNATGQKLKSMKLQLDGGEVRFEKKPYLEMEEDQEPAGGSESESDPTMIFNDMDLLKEKLDEAMQEVIQQEQQEINQQIKKLNKKAEKLARENMKLENQKINFMSKSAGQQFKIDEMIKDMDKIKEELKETHARLDEARIQLESRPSPSLKSRSPLFAAEAAPILIPVKIAPVPTPAPLPGAPMPAPLPGSAPIPAPLPNAAPKPAPVPGIIQKPAPIPGSAPLPASAPIPAPLPGAPIPAPLPGAAPIPATAPMAAPIPAPLPGVAPIAAPLPGLAPIAAPLPGAAPIPSAAPFPGAAPIPMAAPLPGCAAPLPGAPMAAPMPPPIPGMMAPPIPGLPPLPGNLPPPLPGGVGPPPPIFKKKPKKSLVPKPRKKMVPFHWKPIKKMAVIKDSIWSDIALDKVKIDIELNEKPSPNTEQEDQKQTETEDKSENKPETKPPTDDKEHIQLNIDELEKLFGKPDKKKKKKKSSKSSSTKSKKPKREIISLLEDKRSYNMCIALNRFKMANATIRDSILALNENHLNLDKIQKLMPIVPTAEEQEMLKNFDGEPADLDVADKFCYALRDIENLQERLKFWEFKIQFQELCEDEMQRVAIYFKAHGTMQNSTAFKETLQYILIVGNYMNHSTKKGGVQGFNVESLLALNNNKSADKSESLLSFIVKQIRVHNSVALHFAPEFVKVLPPAIKLDPELIKNAIDEIGKTLASLHAKIKDNEEDKQVADIKEKEDDDKKEDDVMEDMFDTKMAVFYEEADKKHKELEKEFNDSQKKLMEFGVYLGQKEDVQFEFMQHMLGFAENVNKVVRAIKKKEMEEQLKKKREEAKRRKKEQRKLRDAKRKEEKEKGTKKSKHKKLKRLAGAAFETQEEKSMSAADSLESKLNVLFAGGLNDGIGHSKTKSTRLKPPKTKKPVTVEEKMHHKIEALPANFADDMLSLLSIDNIQKRRKSRWIGAENVKEQRKKPSKHNQLLGIEDVDDEPVFKRQATEFVIKKPKHKHHKKKVKKRKSRIGRFLGI